MRYKVFSIDSNGRPASFETDVEALDEVRARLRVRGDIVLEERAIGGSFAKIRYARSSSIDVPILCAQLATLLNAGLSVPESVRLLASNASADPYRAVLSALHDQLRAGRTLSAAFAAALPGRSQLLVAMLQAGERTSGIAGALERYREHALRVDAIVSGIRAALLYPLFLTISGGLVVTFLLTFVVPRFARVYEHAHGTLPAAAQLMLAWGRWIDGRAYWVWIAALVLGVGLVLLFVWPAARTWMQDTSLKLPAVAPIARQIHLARLYRTLGALLAGGLPVTRALAQCDDVVPPSMRPALGSTLAGIGEGRPLSESLADANLVTPVTRGLLGAGERSGRLADMSTQAADFLDRETEQVLAAATRLIEPLIMTVCTAVIGTIVVLMYMPIFELAGALQ